MKVQVTGTGLDQTVEVNVGETHLGVAQRAVEQGGGTLPEKYVLVVNGEKKEPQTPIGEQTTAITVGQEATNG